MRTNKPTTGGRKEQKHYVKPENVRSGGCGSNNNSKIKRIKQRVKFRVGYHKR